MVITRDEHNPGYLLVIHRERWTTNYEANSPIFCVSIYEKLTPAAKAYWMAELQAHAAAFHRFLAPFLYCSPDPHNKAFYVFVNTGLGYGYDLEDLARQALFNVLGERVFWECIECVRVVLFSDVLPGNMAFLAPLEELPGFIITARDLSGMVVGKDGGLTMR